MIGLDDGSEKAKKKIMGSVWDIFHSRYCTHNSNISKHLGENISAFFITNDRNLFSLLSKFSLTGIINPDNDSGSTSFYNTDFDYPHLDDGFLEGHIKSTFDLMYERINFEFEFDKEKVNNQLRLLEQLNDFN